MGVGYLGILDPPRVACGASSAIALVVEHDPELRASVVDTLARSYTVRTADDGARALELARELLPEVVVCGVATPELSGYELCRRLRACERTKHLPVVLLLLPNEADPIERALEAGASDYVVTPFRPCELLSRVDLHARLRRLTEKVARQERFVALGELAAQIAHNVRNPLSALLAGLPTVRRRVHAQLDESTGDLMDVMQDCAERIERMTLDLLDLSRIDRDPGGTFSPGVGLLACTRMFGARCTDKAVTLDTDVDPWATSTGRAGEINHVFMNVIDNAFRALGGKGLIRIRGAAEGPDYVVSIEDTGSGIEPALRERVFEPFWTTRPAGEGTGLGLAIARQILEEHGGTIQAGTSELGGASFTIRLPLRRVEHAA